MLPCVCDKLLHLHLSRTSWRVAVCGEHAIVFPYALSYLAQVAVLLYL